MHDETPYLSRYRHYDYSRGAALFFTIATEPRHPWFGRIEKARMLLSPFGRAVEESLVSMPGRVPGVRLYGHVVMPDHVHFRVYLEPGLARPLVTLGAFVGRFRTWTTRLFHRQHPETPTLWQRRDDDRLCVSRRFIECVERYIAYNPLKWELMHGQAQAFRVHEPLPEGRLPDDDYWKGIGRVDLLAPETKMAAVRISRRLPADAVPAAVARLAGAAAKGYTIISTFLSPGERALHRALAADGKSAFIHAHTNVIPVVYKPDIAETPLFAAGRLLVIGRQAAPEDITRDACLDLNAAIAAMARQNGVAVYVRPGEDGRAQFDFS